MLETRRPHYPSLAEAVLGNGLDFTIFEESGCGDENLHMGLTETSREPEGNALVSREGVSRLTPSTSCTTGKNRSFIRALVRLRSSAVWYAKRCFEKENLGYSKILVVNERTRLSRSRKLLNRWWNRYYSFEFLMVATSALNIRL